MGKRACLAEARRSGGVLNSDCVRIGWCQSGENRPQTLNTSELLGEEGASGLQLEARPALVSQYVALEERFVLQSSSGLCSLMERIGLSVAS
jgi:hypothetical protein